MKRARPSPAKKRQKQPAKRKVTPAQARQIAARHVLARFFRDAPVKDGDTCNWNAYNVRRKDVWLVFPRMEPAPVKLCASHVIVVCRRTGRVLYEGTAGDEG